jgi:hypothetical protein
MSPTTLNSKSIRFVAMSLCCLLVAQNPTPAEQAQEVAALKIIILEGDGAINNVKQRTAREPIVQVKDEEERPVAGAMVMFTLPDSGPGGVFANGSKSLMVYTDAQGQATAKGLQPNKTVGKFQIGVNATYKGLTASTTINQANATIGTAASTGVSGKLIAILAIAGGAAAAGVIAATHSGNNPSSSPSSPPSTPISISAGTPTVGGPQ